MAMPVESDTAEVSIPWQIEGDLGEVNIEMCLEQAENLRDKLDDRIQSARSDLSNS